MAPRSPSLAPDADEPSISHVFRASFPDLEREDFRTRVWKRDSHAHEGDLHPLLPTLLHAFAMAAKVEKRGVTMVPDRAGAEEKTLSYEALYQASLRAAAHLKAAGVGRGDRVLIVLPTSFEFILSFFGVMIAGGVPVPSYPPGNVRSGGALDRLEHVVAKAQVKACITNRRIGAVLQGLQERSLHLSRFVHAEDLWADIAPARAPRVKGSDPAFIQYTSGSTAKPKGVLLTHRNLVSNIHASGQVSRVNRKDVMVSWLPMYHDMGLIGTLLFSIYWRIPLVMISPLTFSARPATWLWAIHRHRGTLSPAPSFAYAQCVTRVKPAEREGLDLSSWRIAYNGAQPVSYRTVLDFQRAYEAYGYRPTTMLPVYGLAESSLAVTFPKPGEEVRHELVDRQALANGHAVPGQGRSSIAVVSVGKAMPGHELALVDEDGEPVPERVVGHIVARGPSVMGGYDGDSEATAKILKKGWLWTGDLGYLSDGDLFVSGRAKDLIILRGRNFYADDLERIAERVEGVKLALAFGVLQPEHEGEISVLVIETRLTRAEDREALGRKVAEYVLDFADLRVDEVVMVAPGTIPRTSSGKKQRLLMRERYLRGELEGSRKGRLGSAMVLARSKAGMLLGHMKQLISSQSEPD